MVHVDEVLERYSAYKTRIYNLRYSSTLFFYLASGWPHGPHKGELTGLWPGGLGLGGARSGGSTRLVIYMVYMLDKNKRAALREKEKRTETYSNSHANLTDEQKIDLPVQDKHADPTGHPAPTQTQTETKLDDPKHHKETTTEINIGHAGCAE
jgi:hypothetical protein